MTQTSMAEPGAKQLHNRIASQIVERVRAQRLQAGEHLGEQDLADAFRVSRSPVRVALKLLEHMAVVQRRPNQGFFLRQGWEQLQPPPLTADEQQELKKLFRAGTKLCHPDKVAPEFQAEAALRFQELKEAQLRNDLPRLRALVAALEQGGFGARGAATVSAAAVLRAALSRLLAKRQNLVQEIAALRATPAHEAIAGIADWPAYFTGLRQRLEQQIVEETRHAGA
ncbi:MAG: GntR family transcriptional regulator [Alphaproteobacteria bacterium]